MRVIITTDSSKSPAVTIIGEEKDLVALADSLRDEAERSRIDGSETTYFTLPELVVVAGVYEHLQFGLTAELGPLADQEAAKAKRGGRCGMVLGILGLGVLYLAYRGIATF
jgi:hypothetical protein